jgi:alkanesulfonate monooxygenase SsuD/methylene tetrahydromethanopterin reductase-like flavin-dependent oxidoreductase (luciferase family)
MSKPDVGIQFHLPTHKNLTIQELVELATLAEAGGVKQLWVTDNLQNRNVFVVISALAQNTDLNLGTAVMVHFFRNPVDAAGAIATVTELMGGSEISIGIGRGNIRTSSYIETPRPLGMMKETAQALSALFSGAEVEASEFPILSDYFHYAAGSQFRLNLSPDVQTRVFCGGDGPKTLAIGGRYTDGLLCGTTFRPIAKMGHLPTLLKTFDDAAHDAGKAGPKHRVAEVKISLHKDPKASREFARKGVGSRVLGLRWRGYSADEILKLGIKPEEVDLLEEAKKSGGGTSQELAQLVTDEMIDAFFIAGDMDQCREQVAELLEMAERHEFKQIIFSGISADFRDGLRLLAEEIVPSFS